MEAPLAQQMATLAIPPGVQFSDLQLARQSDGSISFDWSPIRRICTASNIPFELFREAHETNVAGLIISWYVSHLQHGGVRDPVADDFLAAVQTGV